MLPGLTKSGIFPVSSIRELAFTYFIGKGDYQINKTKAKKVKRKEKNHFKACTIHQVLDPAVSYLKPHNTPERSRGLILIFVVVVVIEKVIEDFPQP